jgi:hypothetical protein
MQSINQGEIFKSIWQKEYNSKSQNLKTDTKSPLIEGNTNMGDSESGEGNLQSEEESVRQEKRDFDEAYEEYQNSKQQVDTIRQQYLNVINKNHRIPDDLKDFLGKIVKHNNRFYFINSFGYRREFLDDQSINSECGNKEDAPNVSGRLLSKFEVGDPMQGNLPCNLEGKVIELGIDNIYAYVTPKGTRRNFINEDELRNNDTCPSSSDALPVTSNIFNSMEVGDEMFVDSKCSTFINDPDLENQLISATADLQTKTTNLLDKYEDLIKADDQFITNMENIRSDFQLTIDEIKEQIEKDKKLKIEEKTLKGRYHEEVIDERMEYYQYAGLLTLTLVLGGFTIYHFNKSR